MGMKNMVFVPAGMELLAPWPWHRCPFQGMVAAGSLVNASGVAIPVRSLDRSVRTCTSLSVCGAKGRELADGFCRALTMS